MHVKKCLNYFCVRKMYTPLSYPKYITKKEETMNFKLAC